MSIKNLMINCVESEYTHEYIANVFWRQGIAQVEQITLIPYIKNSDEICNIAYIGIYEWFDTESAFNFIKRLNSPEGESRIVHYDDNWWPVHLNTHNSGDINVGAYTVAFDRTYFEKDTCDDLTAPCTEVDENEFPIKGLGNDYYSVEEALEHVWLLSNKVDEVRTDIEKQRIMYELEHFENELRIHEAVNKSSNVTQRALKLSKRKYDEALKSNAVRELEHNCDNGMFV